MMIDTKDSVHPSFIEIIKQMSPIDAKVFKEISSVDFFPLASLRVDEFFPDANYHKSLMDPLKRRISIDNLPYLQHLDYNQVLIAIDNLLRLRLIIKYSLFKPDEVPEIIKTTALYNEKKELLLKNIINSHCKYCEYCRQLSLTNLGKSFYKICTIE